MQHEANHALNPEDFYMRVGRLIADAPEPSDLSETPFADLYRWMGQAYALAQQHGLISEAAALVAAQQLVTVDLFAAYWNAFAALQRVFWIAELEAPASVSGAFIHAGKEFDALVAVGKVLSLAQRSALFVDPYMDEKVLVDFAVLLKPEVQVKVLADKAKVKPSLAPAVARWKTQYKSERFLDARVTRPHVLHDRLIIIDDQAIWTLTQSLNAFAKRSPASIVKIDAETAELKLAAYREFWDSASES